jgi:hypothetical protein
VSERHFEPEEVQRLIPALSRAMGRVMRARADAAAIGDALRSERERIALAGGGVVDRERWRRQREHLDRLTAEAQEALDEIAAMGGTPKDLALGLVDFPHRRNGREVLLCWKYGEEEIEWWHGLDEGYAGRKRL